MKSLLATRNWWCAAQSTSAKHHSVKTTWKLARLLTWWVVIVELISNHLERMVRHMYVANVNLRHLGLPVAWTEHVLGILAELLLKLCMLPIISKLVSLWRLIDLSFWLLFKSLEGRARHGKQIKVIWLAGFLPIFFIVFVLHLQKLTAGFKSLNICLK